MSRKNQNAQREAFMTAIQEYLKTRVVPVLYDDPDQGLVPIGTSTLLNTGSELFLLSAQHVFEKVQAERLKIPDNFHGPSVIGIWPFDSYDATHDDDDIILLRLKDSAAECARAGWDVVNVERCRAPQRHETFIIGGYPDSLIKHNGGLVGGALVVNYLDRLAKIPCDATKPVDPDCDIFLAYADTGVDTFGATRSTPKLFGVSGAAIWEVDFPDSGSFWNPEKALHLIGVQSSARHFKYARGKQWPLVEAILQRDFNWKRST